MRLWLLSLVAGIILGVAGTPLGKASTGRERAKEEKTASNDDDIPKTSLSCIGSCTKSQIHHLDSSEKEKGEGKEQTEPDPYKESPGTLDLQRTILLQLLNQTTSMNRSSQMDFILRNLNGSSIRDLCEGCCEEREKEELYLSRQPRKTLKVMMFHNDTHIDYQAKKVTHQAENLREGWCSGCCEDNGTLGALERREGEEVKEVPPISTDHGGQVLGNSGSTEKRLAHLSEVSHEARGQFDLGLSKYPTETFPVFPTS
ncbi:uncharacterized protein LOC114027068 isoform X2 [Vombatus ursinus]|uniref:uncharacterized protein LOC114027068 isoform X2 n=1 Tax=Vombatus ursinus TaxID=29139 RepID=UPI000FFD26F6|nr:uncharacterized protein LOC114027068 isoform X2 [Vombatus ursinus]